MNTYSKILLAFGLISMLNACKKDDPEIPNEEELITTMRYVLTNDSTNQTVTFSFKDLDGDGGIAPVISTGTLQANSSYSGRITLLNETESPAEDITLEVAEEALDHQFFYNVSNLNSSVNYTDADANGKPIGITTKVITGAPSNGTLTITLKHQPNKEGQGVAAGDITNAGGESDIEVSFAVSIQ